jgi:hypothetical protein
MKLTIQLAALLATVILPAGADIITIIPASSVATGITDRNTWLAANFSSGATAQTLTSFEDDTKGPWTSLSTTVGTFSVIAGGQGSTGGGTGKNEFTVLNSSNTPFQGRYNTTPGGKNWLDSNDITKLQLTTSFDTIYFFISDADDTGGTLTLQTADGSTATFPTNTGNGSLFFVGITSTDPIGYIRWLDSSRADGYGLDDFGTVTYPPPTPHLSAVPEPASWVISGVALFLVLVIVQRRERKAQP